MTESLNAANTVASTDICLLINYQDDDTVQVKSIDRYGNVRLGTIKMTGDSISVVDFLDSIRPQKKQDA